MSLRDTEFFSGHIIAILAAILFPVFAKAREKARQTACLSNVKQLSLGCLMYSQDYDERWVPIWPGAPTLPGGYILWSHCILPYVKNTQIFSCPSASNQNWGGGLNAAGTAPDQVHGYGANVAWTSTTTDTSHFGPFRASMYGAVSLASVAAPAECIILGDAQFYNPAVYGNTIAYTIEVHNTPSRPPARHNEGCNLGFMDGHAKWFSVTNAVNNSSNWRMWFMCNENHGP